jgi:hypothetical protein
VHCESEVNDETGGGSRRQGEVEGQTKKRRRAGVGVKSGIDPTIVACVWPLYIRF